MEPVTASDGGPCSTVFSVLKYEQASCAIIGVPTHTKNVERTTFMKQALHSCEDHIYDTGAAFL